MFYTIYVGGGRKDRPTTAEDMKNVERVLSIMDKYSCYTLMREELRVMGQAEQVLDDLVAISYIKSAMDVIKIKNMLSEVNVTACSVAMFLDEECTDEIAQFDVDLKRSDVID